MKKIRIGVIGGYRGTSMINYCKRADNAEVVAICDNNKIILDAQRSAAEGLNVEFFEDYDEFIKKEDMDAVVLANFATEHAPFAIKALKAGKHVFSEVLPMQTMKEAVELIETVEETGLVYAYGENYCYMPGPWEMGKLYKKGEIGELEYAECEYVHNCEDIWPSIAYGDKNHWRNNMFSTFYCTHSLGPIIHGTGLRPVKVVGFEATRNARSARMGKKSADFGIEMVTLENGALVKSIHGGLYNNSIWYTMYGTKGSAESGRELSAGSGGVQKVYISSDENVGDYKPTYRHYEPDHGMKDRVDGFGHGGSDFYSMYNFVEKLRGDENADTIDVYEAVDMSLAGMFAFRSILAGGAAMDIPNLREKAEREKWRNDTACCDPNVAGDMLLPTRLGGTPEYPDEVYESQRKLYEAQFGSTEEGSYFNAAITQGSAKKDK